MITNARATLIKSIAPNPFEPGVDICEIFSAPPITTTATVRIFDQNDHIIGFDEKPRSPQPMPGNPTRALASMGNYLFNADILVKALEEDAEQKGAHDFGRDVLPGLLKTKRVQAYNFSDNKIPGVEDYEEEGYWRDVGTVKAYWEANMDLLGMSPRYDLGNREWPIRTEPSHGPPASLVNCHVDNALIGEGTRAVDALIRHSVIGRNVRIEPGAQITDSVISDNTRIGANAHLTCEWRIPRQAAIGV